MLWVNFGRMMPPSTVTAAPAAAVGLHLKEPRPSVYGYAFFLISCPHAHPPLSEPVGEGEQNCQDESIPDPH